MINKKISPITVLLIFATIQLFIPMSFADGDTYKKHIVNGKMLKFHTVWGEESLGTAIVLASAITSISRNSNGQVVISLDKYSYRRIFVSDDDLSDLQKAWVEATKPKPELPRESLQPEVENG